MSDTPSAPARDGSRPTRAILVGGFVAGVLDISSAFVIWGVRGVRPARILQSVASGLLGVAAFTGGARSALLGALLHFFIATTAAAVYYAASRRLPVLVHRPLVWGALYGVAVYLFMNRLVVPLSAAPFRPPSPGMVALQVLVHVFCVGLPIALVVRRHAPAR